MFLFLCSSFKFADVALSSLIHALNDEGLVAIARKVYRANATPVLGALFPRISSKYEVWLLGIFVPYDTLDFRSLQIFTAVCSLSHFHLWVITPVVKGWFANVSENFSASIIKAKWLNSRLVLMFINQATTTQRHHPRMVRKLTFDFVSYNSNIICKVKLHNMLSKSCLRSPPVSHLCHMHFLQFCYSQCKYQLSLTISCRVMVMWLGIFLRLLSCFEFCFSLKKEVRCFCTSLTHLT